jgi:hypothetical protein
LNNEFGWDWDQGIIDNDPSEWRFTVSIMENEEELTMGIYLF